MGESMGLGRVDHRDGEASVVECDGEADPVAASCLEHD
jgi:hypothetical protein